MKKSVKALIFVLGGWFTTSVATAIVVRKAAELTDVDLGDDED